VDKGLVAPKYYWGATKKIPNPSILQSQKFSNLEISNFPTPTPTPTPSKG